MPTPKEEDIKIRVPAAMKSALVALADKRLTTLSEIAREALLEYAEREGITAAQLREGPVGAPVPPTKPVNYRPSKKDNDRTALELVKAAAAKKLRHPAVPRTPPIK